MPNTWAGLHRCVLVALPVADMERADSKALDAPTTAIPGGAGFIGSHLCDRLLESGHRVIAVDDLSTGGLDHLDHLRDPPRFKLLRAALVQSLPNELTAASRIFNLACPASPAYYQQHPIQT